MISDRISSERIQMHNASVYQDIITCPGSGLEISKQTESVLCYCGNLYQPTQREKDSDSNNWKLPTHSEIRTWRKVQIR